MWRGYCPQPPRGELQLKEFIHWPLAERSFGSYLSPSTADWQVAFGCLEKRISGQGNASPDRIRGMFSPMNFLIKRRSEEILGTRTPGLESIDNGGGF